MRNARRALRGRGRGFRIPEQREKTTEFLTYRMRESDTLPQHFEIMERKYDELISLGERCFVGNEPKLIRVWQWSLPEDLREKFREIHMSVGYDKTLNEVKEAMLNWWVEDTKGKVKVRLSRSVQTNSRDITMRKTPLRFRVCDRLSTSISNMASCDRVHREAMVGRSFQGEE